MTKELEVLKKLDLEEREAKVYLALLRLGASTATQISEEVGIDRTTTYDILNRLIGRGVVSYVIKNNIKYFSAAHPQQLLKDLQEKEEELKEVLPHLIALAKTKKEKTNVEVFKGKEGIKTTLKMILRDKKDYLFIGAAHDFCEHIPLFMHKFLREAHGLGIKGKLICEEGFGDSEVDVIGRHEIYRLISKEFTSTTTKVWGNKTAFFVFTEPYYAVLIESKEITDRHRLYFDYLWKQAKEPTRAHKRKTLIKD